MNNLDDYLSKNWTYNYSRRMTYQKIRLYHYGYWKGFRNIFGYKQSYEAFRLINGDCFAYFVKEEDEKLAIHLIRKFSEKEFVLKTVKNLPRKIRKDFDNYLDFVKKIPKDFKEDFDNNKLIAILKRYFQLEQKTSINFWILFGNVEAALTNAIIDVTTNQGYPDKKINELLKKLSEPKEIIPLDMEKLSLLKIALLDKNSQEEQLIKHWKKFAYIPMYDIDYEPYSLEYFKQKLSELEEKSSNDEIRNEIEAIENRYEQRKANYPSLIKEFEGQEEIKYLLEFFSAFSYLKEYKPSVRDKGNFYTKSFFEEISKRLNLKLSQTLFLNEEEMEESLKEELKIKPSELDLRAKNSVYLCKDDEIALIIDKKLLEQIDSILNREKETKELKGLGVSPGIVKGRVAIILSNNDFPKFRQDEILVTSATRPDFVPLMKKAKAIITDEGGLLSHAAIVSRELNKPCIVGTKKGTQIFNNGDLIEVDANIGIIKVLKTK